jgi:hypothetical protein
MQMRFLQPATSHEPQHTTPSVLLTQLLLLQFTGAADLPNQLPTSTTPAQVLIH